MLTNNNNKHLVFVFVVVGGFESNLRLVRSLFLVN